MKTMLLKRTLLVTLLAGAWLPAATCNSSGWDGLYDGFYEETYYCQEDIYYDDYYYEDYYYDDYDTGWGLDLWFNDWW